MKTIVSGLALAGFCGFWPAGTASAQTFDALEYRNVGPTRGGRVTAVAGTVAERGTYYLGASGGGVSGACGLNAARTVIEREAA